MIINIIIIPGARHPKVMLFCFAMFFCSNWNEMIIDLLGNKLGLTLE